MELYHRAITSARENDYTRNMGIANELAARSYAARGLPELARPHALEARRTYLKWGASAKVRDIEEKYPDIVPVITTRKKNLSPGALSPESIDLQTVIKISHALSGEIDLERLIVRLLEIAVENAGAQKGCILLEEAEMLGSRAQGIVNENGFIATGPPAAGASNERLPGSVINYVRRTGEQVVPGNATRDGTFGGDPCITKQRLRSVLCMPIKEQNRMTGILYLENNLLDDAFTRDRIDIKEAILNAMKFAG